MGEQKMGVDLLVALDIGGTKLAVGVALPEEFRKTGRPEAIAKMPVPEPKTPDTVIPCLLRMVRDLAMGRPIGSVGISIGGPLDHRAGVVINFPHLPQWKNVPLRTIIERELGVPATLDNDANLGALAEYRWGAGQGSDPFVYLTISTGIGGGVIVAGELVHGVGSGGGEVGHITVQTGGPLCPCGNRGCLERMASGTNIARRGRELALQDPARCGNVSAGTCRKSRADNGGNGAGRLQKRRSVGPAGVGGGCGISGNWSGQHCARISSAADSAWGGRGASRGRSAAAGAPAPAEPCLLRSAGANRVGSCRARARQRTYWGNDRSVGDETEVSHLLLKLSTKALKKKRPGKLSAGPFWRSAICSR